MSKCRYVITRWYGDLRALQITKEWGRYYKVGPGFDIRKDDPNTLCVTTNPKVTLAKLKPIEAAFIAESKAADEACRARILAARDVRDAAIKGVLEDEQP